MQLPFSQFYVWGIFLLPLRLSLSLSFFFRASCFFFFFFFLGMKVTILLDNKEKWEEYVLFLIDSGSDLLEQTKEGDSVLHLVLEYSNIVEKITTSLSRIKDKYNSDGNTAYTLAIQREFKSTETILRSMVLILFLLHLLLFFNFFFHF